MALKFFWRCESTTLDGTHDYSTGDTTATVNSAAEINSTAGIYGTNGVYCPTGADNYRFDNTSICSGLTEGSVGFSMRITAAPASVGKFGVQLRGTSASEAWYLGFAGLSGWSTGTGQLRLYMSTVAGGAVYVGGASPISNGALNTVYGIVYRFSQASSLRRIEVYSAAGDLLGAVENTDAFTAPDLSAESTGLRVGEDSGDATLVAHIDNVFVADAYAEPLETKLTITSYTEYAGGATPPSLYTIRSGLRF